METLARLMDDARHGDPVAAFILIMAPCLAVLLSVVAYIVIGA